MRIIVLGAGDVGRTVVEALHAEHDVTVIDDDSRRLVPLAGRFDIRPVEGNGTTREVMRRAGVTKADLVIACTSREDSNLVCAMLVKRLSQAQVIVRTTSPEYLEAWRERDLDVDFMVSSELETAYAISGHIGLPAARQTDVFADGKVQVVEFDVHADAPTNGLLGRPLKQASIPANSKVVGLIRGDRAILPRGDEAIRPGDRVVVVASPAAASEWSHLMAREDRKIDDIVIFGGGRMGTTIAQVLLDRGIRVRLVEADKERARAFAEKLPEARIFNASAFDPDFLERERIGRATAGVFAMNDDAKNLYASTLAKMHGLKLTMALVRDHVSLSVYERGGIDVAIDPRHLIAEELVRFAHDPRIRQIVMLEGDRFECLDLSVRPDSPFANRPFRDLPLTDALIGAIIRGDEAIFPHRDDVLRPQDRVILFTESSRAAAVERAL